jgi:hypothetical protein
MPACRVCKGASLEEFLDLGDQPHCNSLLLPEGLAEKEPFYPLKVFFCHDCTTVQIGHTVPKETMFGHYNYVSGTTQTLRQHFADSSQRLRQRLGLKNNDLVVDVGSNDGTWLKTWAPLGMKAVGVEPAQNLAKQANADGAKTYNAFFNLDSASQVRAREGAAALVTAAGVFFHLEELHEATAGVAALIGDTGVFCVQAIYLGEMLRHNEFDNIYHEHLTYWTVRSLGRLLDMHGLEIFSVDLLPIHGGSLEVLAAAKGTRKIENSVAQYLAEEIQRKMDSIETYRAFAKRVWEMRDDLTGILDRLKEAGKTIYAFGAPAKGATTLNSFHIGTQYLDCAVERNPLKIGKIMPGVRLPIKDEASVKEPDAYLILPWNFLPEFLRKKKDYIMNGGTFIVPVPQPMLIDKNNYVEFAA